MKIKALTISIVLFFLALSMQGMDTVSANPTKIFIVNLGNLNRAELAEKINIIQKFDPKVIGIDAVFAKLKDKDGDKKLKSALNIKKNIVLGCFVKFYKGEALGTIVTNPYFGKITYGFCSLIINDKNEAEGIDKFIQVTDENDLIEEVYPLSAEILRKYDANIFEYFDNSVQGVYEFRYSENTEQINTIIEEVDYEDINNKADLSRLSGGIVLLGYIKAGENSQNDDIDTFTSTEINSGLVKGVKIHAYVIGKIINEYYTSKKN